MLLGGLLLNSCKQDEVVSTPTLSVFGPSPALRGGELKFIGTNLDKVTSVILANNIEVKDIVKTSETEISIIIPQTAMPGMVTLKTATGDIKTKTPLTFSEPISIESYTTTSVKASDVFTINGDYLNLVAQVIFTDGAVVDSSKFISKTRKKIQVNVPKAAKSGKVAVSNGALIPAIVFTAGVVTVLDPTTVSSISASPVKPGADLTINGTYLNLVKQIVLPDGNKIDSAAITVNAEKTVITVKVPLVAKEGVVKLITYSGLEILSSTPMKLIAPTITSVSPMLVKNGETLTINGTNLDLVTSATFEGNVTGTVVSKSATSIDVTVPLTAKNGTIVLGTNSGLTATSGAIALVVPAFTALSPMSLTAGETVTITGTNLDLVRKVMFMGAPDVNVTPASGVTSLSVVIPTSAGGLGSVSFVTVNGTQVTSTDQLNIIKATTPAIIAITPAVAPGGLMTITGKNLNYVESIYFQNNVKAILYGLRTENSIQVYVPETAKHGVTTFTLNSFDGKEIVSPSFIYGTDPILSSTVMLTNFNGDGNSQSTWGSPFTFGVPSIPLDGSACMIGKSSVSGWIWSWAANWGSLPVLSNPNNYVLKMDVCITKAVPTGVSAGICLRGWDNSINLGNIFANSTNGQWITLTFDLNKDNPIDGTKDFGFYLDCTSTVDLSGVYLDNFRFDLKSSPSSAPKFRLIGM